MITHEFCLIKPDCAIVCFNPTWVSNSWEKNPCVCNVGVQSMWLLQMLWLYFWRGKQWSKKLRGQGEDPKYKGRVFLSCRFDLGKKGIHLLGSRTVSYVQEKTTTRDTTTCQKKSKSILQNPGFYFWNIGSSLCVYMRSPERGDWLTCGPPLCNTGAVTMGSPWLTSDFLTDDTSYTVGNWLRRKQAKVILGREEKGGVLVTI